MRFVLVNRADKHTVRLKITPNLASIHEMNVGFVTVNLKKIKILNSANSLV